MKLVKVATKTEETKQEQLSRQGKRAKRKGGNYERLIAKKFQDRYGVELKRTPQSGGFAKKSEKADDYRGDITIVDTKQMLKLHIECTKQKQWQLKQWIEQAESDCPKGTAMKWCAESGARMWPRPSSFSRHCPKPKTW